mmetsp:Transcript_14714/g.48099  ORF Transcript_14714/g.48099 Transcript_14714/m.48099 type:complete len:223 (-) Transcript_14714:43-711(-)
MEGMLVPAPVVLGNVEAIHARHPDLLIRGASLDPIVERQVVVGVVHSAVQPAPHKVDRGSKRQHRHGRADLGLDGEQAEHDGVGGEEAEREHADQRPGRRVQHLADPDRRLDQDVPDGEEGPEPEGGPELLTVDAGRTDGRPLRGKSCKRRRVRRHAQHDRRARGEQERIAGAASAAGLLRRLLGASRKQRARMAAHGRLCEQRTVCPPRRGQRRQARRARQ